MHVANISNTMQQTDAVFGELVWHKTQHMERTNKVAN